MTTPNDLDFSMKNAPDEWVNAAPEAQSAASAPRRPQSRSAGPMPTAGSADLFSAIALGLAGALITGVAWYFYEAQELGTTWWLPIVAASVLAIAVRIGAGQKSPGLRLCVTLVLFGLTVIVVGLMTARSNLIAQNDDVTPGTLESQLIFDQFSRNDSLLGLALATMMIAVISFVLHKRT